MNETEILTENARDRSVNGPVWPSFGSRGPDAGAARRPHRPGGQGPPHGRDNPPPPEGGGEVERPESDGDVL